MKCSKCGETMESGIAYCPFCGTRNEPASASMPTIALGSAPQYPNQPPAVSDPYTALPGGYSPQPYQPPQTFNPQAFAPATVPNSTAALISLIFGILSWFALPLIGSIVAVAAGHMGRNEIRASNGSIGGSGMATAGLILGYLNLALFGVMCIVMAFFALVVGS